MTSRLAELDQNRRSGVLLLGEAEPTVSEFVYSRQREASFDIWACTKEIVYRRGANGPEFHYFLNVLDAQTLELVCAPVLCSLGMDDEQVLYGLAMAILNRVPVYPDSVDEEPQLVDWHERLIREGFKTRVDGKDLHFRMGPTVMGRATGNVIDSLSAMRMVSPAELASIRTRLSQRLTELSAAQSTLDRLDTAILSLTEVLQASTRNENAIQDCITRNPILFGPDYRRILPKHRLGSEYEVDYALERLTGLIDLVELESSTLELFTRSGHPRAELVHAEQQILDWVEWIQAHGDYARHKLSGIHRPRGFVVIGRRASLTDATSIKLEQRNRLLGEVITILTYDDLLDRARHLRQLFIEPQSGVTGGSAFATPPTGIDDATPDA